MSVHDASSMRQVAGVVGAVYDCPGTWDFPRSQDGVLGTTIVRGTPFRGGTAFYSTLRAIELLRVLAFPRPHLGNEGSKLERIEPSIPRHRLRGVLQWRPKNDPQYPENNFFSGRFRTPFSRVKRRVIHRGWGPTTTASLFPNPGRSGILRHAKRESTVPNRKAQTETTTN